MKKCVFILLFGASLSVWAQKQPAKTETNTQPQTETQPQTQQKGTNALTDHFYKKYVTAIKWNDFEVAKSALYDLIMENPQNDSLILSLAYHYYENQQHVPAVLVSQELLARNPKNTTALEIAAIGYEAMGVRDRALQNYESLYLLSNNVSVLYKMAFIQ